MTILKVEHLNKRFGEIRAVDDVSLSIESGQFVSLVGANGAGKTSLCNVITAYVIPESGRVFFEDADITQLSITDRIKMGIARSFQLVNLFDELTAVDNVALAIFSREGKSSNIASLARSHRHVWDEADSVLAEFGMRDNRRSPTRTLSQGERKLLDVAVAFALRPKLLFLDEPTSGVGTRDKGAIMDTVATAARAQAITVVIVEHDMDVVFRYSDRIVAMHQGKILADGTPQAIRANEQVVATLLGSGSFSKGG